MLCPPDELLYAYDRAVLDLYAEEECGWNENNRRPAMHRRIRRLREVIMRRLMSNWETDE